MTTTRTQTPTVPPADTGESLTFPFLVIPAIQLGPRALGWKVVIVTDPGLPCAGAANSLHTISYPHYILHTYIRSTRPGEQPPLVGVARHTHAAAVDTAAISCNEGEGKKTVASSHHHYHIHHHTTATATLLATTTLRAC